jgi:hypothetical protein
MKVAATFTGSTYDRPQKIDQMTYLDIQKTYMANVAEPLTSPALAAVRFFLTVNTTYIYSNK